MPHSPRQLLEVGPGLGDLTVEILKTRKLIAVEIDSELCKRLQARFAPELLKLICADVLDLWQTSLIDKPFDLIGNLPYYAASEIILRALRDPLCGTIVAMTQKEVAEKWTAKSKMREFCALSVLCQSVGEAEFLFEVPKEAFNPAPKVTSAVIRITKTKPSYDRDFAVFLRCAFAQPRKQLAGNLQASYGRAMITQAFAAHQIKENARAHEVALEQFSALYLSLKGTENGRTREHDG